MVGRRASATAMPAPRVAIPTALRPNRPNSAQLPPSVITAMPSWVSVERMGLPAMRSSE